jgi:YidC/Oxa1 family membrane protein insertase
VNPWDLIAVQPMTNILIVISHGLFNSPGLAIIAITIIINLALLPLTLKQVRSSKAMQDVQPKLLELQKKYGKDKQKIAQEQMRLYKEAGMSPAGCIVPLLVQTPIWIALYQAIIRLLAATPDDFLGLGRYLYSWSVNFSTLPLGNRFLWFDLSQPDTFLILPLLVGASMWVQQKMVTTPNPDPRQQSQSQMMLWMMPLMFGFFSMQFASGLSLYWVVSSLIRIGTQYFVTGWGGLIPHKATTGQAVITKRV